MQFKILAGENHHHLCRTLLLAAGQYKQQQSISRGAKMLRRERQPCIADVGGDQRVQMRRSLLTVYATVIQGHQGHS